MQIWNKKRAGQSLALALALSPGLAWAQEEQPEPPAVQEVGDIEIEEIPILSSRTLTLEQAMELAEQGSPDLKAVRERLKQASLLRDRAFAVLIPTVKVQSILTLYDEEVSFSQGPVFIPNEMGGFDTITPDPVVVQPRLAWRNTGTISSSFDARIFPLLDVAQNAEEVARLGGSQARHEIRYGVLLSVQQLMTLRDLMKISQYSIEARQTLLQAAQARLSSGVGTEFDVTRARVELLKAKKDLNQVRISYLKAREALALLLVTEPDFTIASPAQRPEPASLQSVLDQAMENNPALLLARENVELSRNNLRVSEWAWLPTLTVQLNATQQPETIFAPGFQWYGQLIAGWTLYDGGQRGAQIDEDGSKLVQARLDLEKAELKVKSDVRQAWLELRSRSQQRQVFAQEVKLGQLALQQAQDGYALGAVPQLDVLNAEIQLRIARTQLANEELAYQIALSDLFRLIGQKPQP